MAGFVIAGIGAVLLVIELITISAMCFCCKQGAKTLSTQNRNDTNVPLINKWTRAIPIAFPVYSQQSSYTSQQPSYTSQQSSYTSQQPTFAPQQPSYTSQQSSYTSQQPTFAPQQPTFAPQQPSYVSQQSSYASQHTGYMPQYGYVSQQ